MSDCTYHCISSLKQEHTTDVAICKSFDFGTSLEKIYPLLQIIFEKLPYEDLESAALVSSIWQKYASDELQKRNNASWISLLRAKCAYKIEMSYNYKYDSVLFGFIFYKYKTIKLNKYMCVHGDELIRMTFTEYLLQEVVPPNIDFWAFSCTEIYSPEKEKGAKTSFVGLFIPEIPNIRIKKFFISDETNDAIGNNFSENEHVHCTLLFSVACAEQRVKDFTKNMLERQNETPFALAGGLISGGIKPFQKNKSRNIFSSKTVFCIAFAQDKDKVAMFDSYSVVIEEKENFEEKLTEFKKNIKLRKRSLALRICCAAKENNHAETDIFNKIFPKSSIVGIDADGEIGWNKFDSWQPEEDIPETKKSRQQHSTTQHEYTTVIVMITWGRPL